MGGVLGKDDDIVSLSFDELAHFRLVKAHELQKHFDNKKLETDATKPKQKARPPLQSFASVKDLFEAKSKGELESGDLVRVRANADDVVFGSVGWTDVGHRGMPAPLARALVCEEGEGEKETKVSRFRPLKVRLCDVGGFGAVVHVDVASASVQELVPMDPQALAVKEWTSGSEFAQFAVAVAQARRYLEWLLHPSSDVFWDLRVSFAQDREWLQLVRVEL